MNAIKKGPVFPSAYARPVRDRRNANRLTVPSCPACTSLHSSVIIRTDYSVNARCDRCTHVWSQPKPGYECVEA
jgi:hypothetical protein